MPIFEYYSPDKHRIYTFFARSAGMNDRTPRCPDGGSRPLRRVASRFAFVGRARQPGGGMGGDGLDDPGMDAAMREIESEFSGMDEANPDPRQLGRMMRRMADLTGEVMPDQFEEMVGRLEAGEDPEKLEDEFGDVLDDDSFMDGNDEAGEGAGGGSRKTGRFRALTRRRPPRRDPKLYELSDYLGDCD